MKLKFVVYILYFCQKYMKKLFWRSGQFRRIQSKGTGFDVGMRSISVFFSQTCEWIIFFQGMLHSIKSENLISSNEIKMFMKCLQIFIFHLDSNSKFQIVTNWDCLQLRRRIRLQLPIASNCDCLRATLN